MRYRSTPIKMALEPINSAPPTPPDPLAVRALFRVRSFGAFIVLSITAECSMLDEEGTAWRASKECGKISVSIKGIEYRFRTTFSVMDSTEMVLLRTGTRPPHVAVRS